MYPLIRVVSLGVVSLSCNSVVFSIISDAYKCPVIFENSLINGKQNPYISIVNGVLFISNFV